MSTDQSIDAPPERDYERRLTLALEAIAQPPLATPVRSSLSGVVQSVILIVLMLISVTLSALALMASRQAEQSAAATQQQLKDANQEAVDTTAKDTTTAARNLSEAKRELSELVKDPQVSKLHELLTNLNGAKSRLEELGNELDGAENKEGLTDRLKTLRTDIDAASKEHLKLLKDRRDEFDATLALIPKEEGALNSKLVRTLGDINRSVETLERMVKRVDRLETVRLVTTKTSSAQTAAMEVAMLLEAAEAAKRAADKEYKLTHKNFAVELWHVGNGGLIQISDKGGVPGEKSILSEVKFDPPHIRYVFIVHASVRANVPSQASNTMQVIDAVIVKNVDDLKSAELNSQILLGEYNAWQNICDHSYGEVKLVIGKFEKEKDGRIRLDKKSQALLVEAIARLVAPRRNWPVGPTITPAPAATPVKG